MNDLDLELDATPVLCDCRDPRCVGDCLVAAVDLIDPEDPWDAVRLGIL